MGLAKPSETRSWTGTGPGLDHQAVVGWVIGQFCNRTVPFVHSSPSPLGGYPDWLPTVALTSALQPDLTIPVGINVTDK